MTHLFRSRNLIKIIDALALVSASANAEQTVALVDYTTYHDSNARLGWNARKTQLWLETLT